MRVLVIRGRRTDRLLLAWERSKGLLLRKGFKDRVTAPRAKARISHPKMGGTLGLLASQGKGCVSSATSLDTLDEISVRGRDPRIMGHHSPNHQWDMHRRSLFLLTPPWAREDNISPRVLHKHLLFRNTLQGPGKTISILFCRHATRARVWVEIEDKAHRLGLRRPRGMSTPLHHRLR